MDMEIRKIEVSEMDLYVPAIKQIYREALGYSEDAADFLITRIRKSDEGGLHTILLGAFEGERLAGFVFGFDFAPQNWWAQQIDARLPNDLDWYKSTFELNELAVDPRMQGKGIGRALMEQLLGAIPHQSVLLGTKKHKNDHVIRLYKRLGFEIVIDDFRYEGNLYGTSLIMGWKKP